MHQFVCKQPLDNGLYKDLENPPECCMISYEWCLVPQVCPLVCNPNGSWYYGSLGCRYPPRETRITI